MQDDLKQDVLHALFYFKKASAAISRFLVNAEGGGLSVTELSALNCIEGGGEKGCDTADAARPADQTTHHAMHETLAVSKAAVSQILGSLEKREYIQRETDRDNRRKIIITVTEKGKTAVDQGKKQMDTLMSRIITGLGEEDARHFVRLLDRFAEVVDEELSKVD
ncbi:MAG: winged helix DNA-binding protein [Treponema sp.]|jgi:DNA-binding MarR family transcriptional regulator|nr:winged helix DNA-binding protein [Treponema sp.]